MIFRTGSLIVLLAALITAFAFYGNTKFLLPGDESRVSNGKSVFQTIQNEEK
jgi:hypothetical protein